jgi:hypothetical protein
MDPLVLGLVAFVAGCLALLQALRTTRRERQAQRVAPSILPTPPPGQPSYVLPTPDPDLRQYVERTTKPPAPRS